MPVVCEKLPDIGPAASGKPIPPHQGECRYAAIRNQRPAPPSHFGAPLVCCGNVRRERSESQWPDGSLKRQVRVAAGASPNRHSVSREVCRTRAVGPSPCTALIQSCKLAGNESIAAYYRRACLIILRPDTTKCTSEKKNRPSRARRCCSSAQARTVGSSTRLF